jgi:hypothetical protein
MSIQLPLAAVLAQWCEESVSISRPAAAVYDASGVAQWPTAWAQHTAYAVGDCVKCGTSYYVCTQAGTSASTGTGPSGTGTGITDGTNTTWSFLAVAALSGLDAHVERPASQGDLLHLPEGDRIKRTAAIWCATELLFRDLVTLSDGEVYEIQHVEPWNSCAGFWRAVGVKTQT